MIVRDDRYGCRSLVCDANGIIIAEMVHRCMICAHISESINDARKHYQEIHFESSDRDSPQLDEGGEGNHDVHDEEEDREVMEEDREVEEEDREVMEEEMNVPPNHVVEGQDREEFENPASSSEGLSAPSSQGRLDVSTGECSIDD